MAATPERRWIALFWWRVLRGALSVLTPVGFLDYCLMLYSKWWRARVGTNAGGFGMSIELRTIGFVRTDAEELPRHWSVSEVEGTLVIDEQYSEGLRDIEPGQRIVVIFNFHRSPLFSPEFLRQTSGRDGSEMGVFSICSPIRPNPIGMSVVEVIGIRGSNISVRRLDMLDGTPILDIKPYIEDRRG
jgi:tRNA (adenine37-N6)-methyltransferase